MSGIDLVRTCCDDEGNDIERHAEACVWIEAMIQDYQRQFGQCWRPEVSHSEEEEFLCLASVIDWGTQDIFGVQKEVPSRLARHRKGVCLGKRGGGGAARYVLSFLTYVHIAL